MTDINVMITNAETGEELDKFSVHRGNSSTMSILVDKVRDSVSIHSELQLDHFVHIAKEGQKQPEKVAEFLSRIAVPGGWLYRYAGDKNLVYVPDNRNEGSYLGATVVRIKEE